MAVHRVFILSTLLIAQVLLARAEDDEPQSCTDLLDTENPEECCESFRIFKQFEEAMNECSQKDSNEFDCADFECVFKKKGILNGNTIDEKAAKKLFTDTAVTHPEEKEIISTMIDKCFNGNYNNFPLIEESCAAINFYSCTYVHFLLECKWKQTADCKEMSENAKKCKTELEKLE